MERLVNSDLNWVIFVVLFIAVVLSIVFGNEKYIDKVRNSYLRVMCWVRYLLFIRKKNILKVPKEVDDWYESVFFDSFSVFNSVMWRKGFPWGNTHPDYLHAWFSDNNVSVKKPARHGGNKCLVLQTMHSPYYFDDSLDVIPYSTGVCISKMEFKYGYFRFVVRLPKATGQWPAVWLAGTKTWPPEIDILEAYSKNTVDYKKHKTLQPNVHWGDDVTNHFKHGGVNIPMRVQKEGWLELALWWTKDFIKIYYNGYKVLHISRDEVLIWFNQSMNIILSSGVEYEQPVEPHSEFEISLVEVLQHKHRNDDNN